MKGTTRCIKCVGGEIEILALFLDDFLDGRSVRKKTGLTFGNTLYKIVGGKMYAPT